MTLHLSPGADIEALRGPSSSLARRRVRRLVGRALAAACNALRPTPVGRWLHGRLLPNLELVLLEPELPATRGVAWPSIAFLSDLHLGYYMSAADLEGLAVRLMALRPDVVCLGGDLINQRAREMELLWPALRRLSAAPLGVFAVPGNHDYVEPGELEPWSEPLEAAGVRVLRNRGLRVEHRGATFWFSGVDDLTEGEPDLATALAGRRAGEPTLLLSHHPDVFREASARGVDLQLSGHTHGGQIRFFGWAPLHHSRFGWVEGLHARGASRLYVGRGGGVTALPVRIGTRGEATLLRPRAPSG